MVKSFVKSVLEFLFPPACPLCGAPVSIHGELCGDCWTAFNWIDGSKCIRCGYPFALDMDNAMCPICASGKCELDWIRSACVYDDASRMAMLPFKHSGRILYAHFMSRAMIWALRDIDTSDIDFIMPVPLANRRLFKRSYNQATLLARPIARALGLKLDYDSVRRKHRSSMGHLNSRQRAENIHGVFSVSCPEKIRGKNILLVDDVMTSGATFSELRRVLINAGAANVYGVTFCRVVRAS
ncbi:MAG: ComF family protein [Alphaproteobacteria bacterium]|nr:ComF family protein [Alphaproteobacteria bacterium]